MFLKNYEDQLETHENEIRYEIEQLPKPKITSKYPNKESHGGGGCVKGGRKEGRKYPIFLSYEKCKCCVPPRDHVLTKSQLRIETEWGFYLDSLADVLNPVIKRHAIRAFQNMVEDNPGSALCRMGNPKDDFPKAIASMTFVVDYKTHPHRYGKNFVSFSFGC